MHSKRILIVDDDKGQLLRLQTLLVQRGYEVIQADSGSEALALAQTSSPDIVLSDVLMDDMDGYELAMALKADPALRHIAIALHSSVFNDSKARLLAEAIGVVGFFDKSMASSELLRNLELLSECSDSANDAAFDEEYILRMRARVLSEKVGSTNTELELERQRADTTAQQLQFVTDAMPDLISEIGPDYRYRYVNHAYEEWHHKRWHEIVGMHVQELHGQETYALIRPQLERAMHGDVINYEERFNYSGKGVRDMWVRYLPQADGDGVVSSVHVIVSDITERKAAEVRLKKTNRCYLILVEINKLISRAESEQELLDGACQIICQGGDFPLAWIGKIQHDPDKTVIPVASAGFGKNHLESLHVSWADNEYGRGPTGRAARMLQPQTAEDIFNNPEYIPWRKQAMMHGYASAIALPITIEGGVVAVLNIYARDPFSFAANDTDLLEKLAGDIGHGFHALQLKQERSEIAESLRKANRAYRTLVQLKQAMNQYHTECELLQAGCRILMDSGSYHLAWIGFAQSDEEKTISPVAFAGDHENYLDEMVFSWGDNTLGQGPTGRSIRQSQTVIINDTATDPDFKPWRAAANRRGYASSIAIPMRSDGKILGCLTLYSDVANAFYPEEVELLEEFATELSYGVTALRKQDKHQRTAGELAYQRMLFEAVFRHIPDTMVITDTEHRIILCNSALIRDFGYYPEELYGQSPAVLYADETEFKRQQDLRFHSDAHDINTPYYIDYRRKDGSSFEAETLGAVFRTKETKLLGYITIIRDISERRALESEHAQLEQQLQQAQKMEMVGQLTGGIAHDFNNILASILGYTELAQLLSEKIPADRGSRMRRYLDEIQGAGGRARDIIAKLLAFSRTGSSEQQSIDLYPLIKETASLLRPTFSSSIELQLKLQDDVPKIEADPSQLHQVLMNLCINARDAMAGRGSIVIGLQHDTKQKGQCSACGEKFCGDYLTLSVSDNGSGIPEEILGRMFDPFFTTKEVGKGSGMGLSMVHGIVHEHRGHLEVTTSSKGSSFNIYLPVSRAVGNTNHPHLVFVDDEPLVLEFMQQLLSFNGYQVTGFHDPAVALEELTDRNLPCDLLITDKVMPGMNGVELAQRIQHVRPELPLILCSASLEEISEDEAQEVGFVGMLAKPIESTRLISLIQKSLGGGKVPTRHCRR